MGPLRVSNVLRPDNRVAAGPNGRGVFYVGLGPLVCVVIFGRVFSECLGVVVLARSACGLGWAPVAQVYSC